MHYVAWKLIYLELFSNAVFKGWKYALGWGLVWLVSDTLCQFQTLFLR